MAFRVKEQEFNGNGFDVQNANWFDTGDAMILTDGEHVIEYAGKRVPVVVKGNKITVQTREAGGDWGGIHLPEANIAVDKDVTDTLFEYAKISNITFDCLGVGDQVLVIDGDVFSKGGQKRTVVEWFEE